MKVIKPSVEIITPVDGDYILKHIENIARICYKSEDHITEDSAKRFIANLIKSGHEAMIEHFNITFKFVCDRAVSHELVRHRMASFAQESQRYISYSKEKFGNEITYIEPSHWVIDSWEYNVWKIACLKAEQAYFELLELGCTPQQARAVLPNSTKTEIVVTMNLRELRHMLKLRTAKSAHPDFRVLAIELLNQLKDKIPVVFDDIIGE